MKAIDHIGEQNFQDDDDCIGHGNLELSNLWEETFASHEAPEGFIYIKDAEMVPVALVPLDLAEHFVEVLNAAESAYV
jgi:hypothetical protein